MKTGILGGFFTGTALSALVLGGASIMTYQPPAAPDATAVDVPAGSEFRQSREDTEASLPGSDDTPDAAEKPRIEAPEPDDLASLEEASTAPASQPTPGSADAGINAPDAPDAPSGVDLGVEQPVLPSPQSLAPQTPDTETDLSISTEPAQPIQPDEGQDSAFEEDVTAALTPDTEAAPDVQTEITEPGAAPEEEPSPEVTTDTTPQVDVDPEPTPEVEAEVEPTPEVDVDPEPAQEVDVTEEATPEPEVAEETTPDVEAAEEPAPDAEVAEEPTPSEEVEAEVTPQVEVEETPQVAVEPDVQTEPSGTIGNLAESVTVGRLPSVSEPEVAETEDDAQTEAETIPEGDQTPLDRYSMAFENPEGKPLMSFVLLDQGDSPISYDALADFPYPISYAVDVAAPDAEGAMRRYRDAGLEVLAMIDLPEGAAAVDTEVAMQTYLSALPETVAVMEGVGTGLQSSREATEQLIPILQESGHGLVLFSEGFDTAQKLISREGVPALSVFRDIDSNDQAATVIRRFLDQAAFRAGQEEVGVIIVGRLRAETVSALLLWGLQDRANSVAIAPVSALLKSSQVTE